MPINSSSLPVSVIVPVYNAADYLERCLDSVISQSFSSFELILINDGSVDGSGEICDRYAAADPRIRVFHQPNGGPGRARNLGLEVAQGEFIALIDADDWLEATYLERLLDASQGQDLVVCGYVREYPTYSEPRLLGREGVIDRATLLEQTFCSAVLTAGCWNKLLRRELIERDRLRFAPDILWGEDMLFLAHYYRQCDQAHYINEPLYHYRLNPASLMKSIHSERMFRVEMASVLDALGEMEACFDPRNPLDANVLGYRRTRSSVLLLLHLAVGRYHDRELLAGLGLQVKAGYKAVWRTTYASLGERGAAALIYASPRLAYHCAVLATRLFPAWVQRQLR